MARFEDGSYGTVASRALIAKILAGRCTMKYTRAAAGKGAIPDGSTPATMDGPADYVMDVRISNVTNPVDGECQVSVQINSKDVETGFYATCIVLYAEDPDLGEIPYTYLVLENEPEWIRPASAIVGKLATFDIIAAVGEVDTIAAVIDPEAIATVGYVDQMIQAHNAAIAIAISIPASAWTLDEAAADKYSYYADVEDEQIILEHCPDVALDKGCLEAACVCGLCPVADIPSAGVVRFYAQAVPTAEISGTCTLWLRGAGGAGTGTGTGTGTGGSGTYALPVASATTLGGVKIGDGINVSADGTITPDALTEEEIREILN